jgi:hypothetical protein
VFKELEEYGKRENAEEKLNNYQEELQVSNYEDREFKLRLKE